MHFFKPYKGTPRKVALGHKLWHCDVCDSIVSYPKKYNEFDVNKSVNNSKFMCLPRVVN